MISLSSLVFRAGAIVLVFFLIGVGSNLIRARPLHWLYVPPTEITILNHKIPLVSSKEAIKWLDDPLVVFVDTRDDKDYLKGHVRGAVSLSPDDKEQKFPGIEPLMPQGSKLILYCYGPDCDMAEHVALFLIDFGYSDIMIMKDGYPGWEQNGFPTQK
jgi:rhodanese-related sulfurtransferase